MYTIIFGKGKIIIDNEEIILKGGDWFKVKPAAKRQIFASDESTITYVCIQVKENSLDTYTNSDAIIVE
ncbi:MAG: hypothetical protein LBR40_00875 [Bacilli bacterium]|nr:hypothetical protein [Bacilli bacterium]